MAVDMTARARMPGARKSIGSSTPGRQHVDGAEEHEQQHRDAEHEQQRLAPPEGERRPPRGSGPGAVRARTPGPSPRLAPPATAAAAARRRRRVLRSAPPRQAPGRSAPGRRPPAAAGRPAGRPAGCRGRPARRSARRRRPGRAAASTTYSPGPSSLTSAPRRGPEPGDVQPAAERRSGSPPCGIARRARPGARRRPGGRRSMMTHGVGHPLGLLELVGGEHDAAARRRAGDRIRERTCWRPATSTDAVGSSRNSDVGRAGQRQGERQPLLLAARQLAPRTPGPLGRARPRREARRARRRWP